MKLQPPEVQHYALLGIPSTWETALTWSTTYKRLQVYRDALNDYNTLLSAMDEKRLIAKALEKEMKDLSTRMLAYVAARYGKDSIEYAKAGGTKTSERKKPKRSSGSAD